MTRGSHKVWGSAACGLPTVLQTRAPLPSPESPGRPGTAALFTVRSQCDVGEWGRGGCRGFLSRTEQGTEIQREGQGPRPHPREAAPGQARLGSRTGGTRPGAGGSQGWSGMNPRS